MEQSSKWFKNNPNDKIWWLDNPRRKGEWVFSFDKKTEFNMFSDYPHALTSEQKKIHIGRTFSKTEHKNMYF